MIYWDPIIYQLNQDYKPFWIVLDEQKYVYFNSTFFLDIRRTAKKAYKTKQRKTNLGKQETEKNIIFELK